MVRLTVVAKIAFYVFIWSENFLGLSVYVTGVDNTAPEDYDPCFHQDKCLNYPCHNFNDYINILDKIHHSVRISHDHFTQCDNIENSQCHMNSTNHLRTVAEIQAILRDKENMDSHSNSLNHERHTDKKNNYSDSQDQNHRFNHSVTWHDTLFYLPVAKNLFRMNIQYYWLDIFLDYIPVNATVSPFVINYILITEEDSRMTLPLLKPYFSKYTKFLNISMVRVPQRVHDDYNQLVCKMTVGMKLIYEMFPNKKYYMKIDDDTLIYPNRLLKLLTTMNLFFRVDTIPIYLGMFISFVSYSYIYYYYLL
jgi:Galactosyltransferase